jgi:hypothetical protein
VDSAGPPRTVRRSPTPRRSRRSESRSTSIPSSGRRRSATGLIAFNLANFTLSNWKRALNGGAAALTSTGTTGTELTTFQPPAPGTEVRSMLIWESTDSTVRILIRQGIQGGEVASAFQKAPSIAAIPCTFNFEIPSAGVQPFQMWGAGLTRV